MPFLQEDKPEEQGQEIDLEQQTLGGGVVSGGNVQKKPTQSGQFVNLSKYREANVGAPERMAKEIGEDISERRGELKSDITKYAAGYSKDRLDTWNESKARNAALALMKGGDYVGAETSLTESGYDPNKFSESMVMPEWYNPELERGISTLETRVKNLRNEGGLGQELKRIQSPEITRGQSLLDQYLLQTSEGSRKPIENITDTYNTSQRKYDVNRLAMQLGAEDTRKDLANIEAQTGDIDYNAILSGLTSDVTDYGTKFGDYTTQSGTVPDAEAKVSELNDLKTATSSILTEDGTLSMAAFKALTPEMKAIIEAQPWWKAAFDSQFSYGTERPTKTEILGGMNTNINTAQAELNTLLGGLGSQESYLTSTREDILEQQAQQAALANLLNKEYTASDLQTL